MFPQRQLQSDAGNVRVRRGEAFTIAASAASVGLNFDEVLPWSLSPTHMLLAGAPSSQVWLIRSVNMGSHLGSPIRPRWGCHHVKVNPPLQSTARLPLLLPSAAPRQLPPLER